MTKQLRGRSSGYPAQGELVYFVGTGEADDRPPFVYVGCVLESSTALGGLFAVQVLSWDRIDQDSALPDVPVRYSAHDLFTAEQVREEINTSGGPLAIDPRELSDIGIDPATNWQLVGVLSVATLRRQLEADCLA
jgi:hypothetical protein